MDIIKANINDEIILEFDSDRYGEEIIREQEFKKELISKITQISKEIVSKKNDYKIITNHNGYINFDIMMRNQE